VVGSRKELGVWSIFNILGPLCNPAGIKNGIIGVFSPRLIPLIAEACLQLKMEHLFIVHGNDGLDEFTTTTTTQVTEIFQGKLKTLEVSPADFNLPMVGSSELIGGEPTENATITRPLLTGEKEPKRDIVLLNSTFAIIAAGKAQTPKEAFKMATESIDSGKALAKLDALVKMSNE
jgi:anthranilate phosphoribosyltransferase